MDKRKPQIEYQLHVNYGQGWEHEITEDTLAEARERVKEYNCNCPQYPVKIIRKRAKA